MSSLASHHATCIGRWTGGMYRHCAWPDYGWTSNLGLGPQWVAENL